MAKKYQDEIDAIFERVQQTIDLDKVKSASDLKRSIKEYKKANNQKGGFSERLADLIMGRKNLKEEIGVEYYVARAVQEESKIKIGETILKSFEAIYNKKSGTAQIIARSKITGRFVKFKTKEINQVIGG